MDFDFGLINVGDFLKNVADDRAINIIQRKRRMANQLMGDKCGMRHAPV